MALPIVAPSSEMLQEKEVLFMKYLSPFNASGPSGITIKATLLEMAGIFSELMKKVQIFLFGCDMDLQN